MSLKKRIRVPTTTGTKTNSKHQWRGPGKKKQPTPVRLTAIRTPPQPPTLCFARRYPKCTWMVPPLSAPVYWFDIMMVRKKLITHIPPQHFVVDGRRFRILAQDHKVTGIGYTRWLVVEEHPLIPKD